MLRYHEIAEADHRILNPFTDQKLALLGEVCRLRPGQRLLDLVLADGDSWDRYAASQWWTIDRWLRANPVDPDAPAMREFLDQGRRAHLASAATTSAGARSCCGLAAPDASHQPARSPG